VLRRLRVTWRYIPIRFITLYRCLDQTSFQSDTRQPTEKTNGKFSIYFSDPFVVIIKKIYCFSIQNFEARESGKGNMTMLEKLLKNLTLVRICNTRLSFPNSPMKGMGIGSMFSFWFPWLGSIGRVKGFYTPVRTTTWTACLRGNGGTLVIVGDDIRNRRGWNMT